MDCSLAGSSVHGIFQARILEQVAISYSRGTFGCTCLHFLIALCPSLGLIPSGKSGKVSAFLSPTIKLLIVVKWLKPDFQNAYWMLMTKLNPLFAGALRLIWGWTDWESGSGTYINIHRHTETRERYRWNFSALKLGWELQKMLRKELEIEKKKNTYVCSSTANKWEWIPMRTCYG